MLELFLVWEVQLFYRHSSFHLDGKHLYCYYDLGNYATINQIMLKIIFGNIVRKEYYYLNKSNIYIYIYKIINKKLALKVTEKILFFFFTKKFKIGSIWLDPRVTRTWGRVEYWTRTRPKHSSNPPKTLRVGLGRLGWLGWPDFCSTLNLTTLFNVTFYNSIIKRGVIGNEDLPFCLGNLRSKKYSS